MKLFLSLLFAAAISAAGAQTIKNNQVVIGKTDSIRSKILNEERTVWIYLPPGYDASGKTRYPVTYLLDAEWNFAAFTGMVNELSSVIGNTVVPQMIVVAIPNTARTRDLTPTHTLMGSDGKVDSSFKTSGGGENFTAFIKTELMPHIDSAYHTAPYKLLVGHSFGGITAMNIFLNHTDMFNSYLVIDPSMWWDGRKLLNQAREQLKQKRFAGKSLYLGIANTMPMGLDTLNVQRDTADITFHIRSILLLKNMLQQNPQNGLNWGYRYYGGDSHGTAPLISEYDGLHFLFSFYDFPPGFLGSLFSADAKINVGEFFTKHFEEVSKQLGYTVLPPEDLMNNVGGYCLSVNLPDRAFAAFDLNLKNYPDSPGALVSMGDYYAAQKNAQKAGEYYTRALKLKDDPDTRKKLDKLKLGK